MALTPNDRDALIRTVIGEAGAEPLAGQAAVAHVILNRVASGGYGGRNVESVVHAPNQFETWKVHGDRLAKLTPDSPEYRKVAGVIDNVLSGSLPDPTGGATHFYQPDLGAAQGRNTPKWASGVPLAVIGAHQFYSPDRPARSTPATPAPGNALAAAAGAPQPDFANAFSGVPRPDVNATFGTAPQPGPDFGSAFPPQQGDFAPAPPAAGDSNMMAQLRLLNSLAPRRPMGAPASNALQALNVLAPHIQGVA